MTWSIVVRDPKTGAFGVAVATKFFAVGAICPYGKSEVGAASTQALVNPFYGITGIKMLEAGVPAPEALRILTQADAGRETRQFHMIDAAGSNAAHTGRDCVEWSGHVIAENVSVAGNMLAGPQVIHETLKAYQASMDQPLDERLLRALEAGDAAGGDKRGRQSACLVIHAGEEYPQLDIRVDDHTLPLPELRRLRDVARTHYLPFTGCLAKKGDPVGIYDRAKVMDVIAKAQAALS
ncbi:MAG: DUF1028 domain-containing protein [Alphaproteobacteria bacterium]|nr:DUF1028 domain-containing protein [Alphaproteobacteria bacterium]